MELINCNNLSKDYHTRGEIVHAVRNMSFSISKGEFVTIMGHSGSGKSTLLSLLGGLSKPDGGSLLVDTIDVNLLDMEQIAAFRREYIGFVFQSFQLVPYLTVIENVMIPLVTASISSNEKRNRAVSGLEQVGLANKSKRLVDELSGGEQQRVSIARALINDPPVILADEPTGNLDTKTGYEIMKLFTKLNGQGRTIIIVTHNEEFKNYSNRIIQLTDGILIS